MAIVTNKGGNYHDFLLSSTHDDMVSGENGNDMLVDAGLRGGKDLDVFSGGKYNDKIFTRWGSDTLQGGYGDDLLVSRSDAGEPEIAQDPKAPRGLPDETIGPANDNMNGGLGRDTFLFRLDLNARPDVIAAHTDLSGYIDWSAIAHDDTGGPHSHWVEGIGRDTIQDFYRDEGDKIKIMGYSVTAEIRYDDSNGDGRDDYSIVRLTSDTGGMGPHHGDYLGTIRVFGDMITMDDLDIDSMRDDTMPGGGMDGMTHDGMAMPGVVDTIDDVLSWTNVTATAGNDILRTAAANATLKGLDGDDLLLDAGRRGDKDRDVFDGGAGNDIIRTRWGNDLLIGGLGDDVLFSKSDAGEPDIAQRHDEKHIRKVYANEPYLQADDTMIGGLGADTFYFRVDLSARKEIVKAYVEDDGTIMWHQVAGRNGAIHLHWVEAMGTDVVKDFYHSDGDKIVIQGHTVQPTIYYRDSDGDHRKDMSIILVRSNQGSSGAHNKDILAGIKVYGDLVSYDDLVVDNSQALGMADNINEFGIL